jgi:DNA polymerase III subunit gamma/tau
MSYQVLARKWRPKNFAELMGQEHVVRALVGGLEQGRLHHAFLFTGTRGVGKTTIARIIAKALNCEAALSANPCGTCNTCLDIDAGRYTDLMEIDAASRTKVDDTRELLDNVIYAPARGRFKVYLIDEVHMLSINSFNALLKTLEEPPPHVKFLLATTDPQKLPITVLSRCLKFHLKRLTVPQINQQMTLILHAEGIQFEPDGVLELARAADGSMRDGLSLLDQALAFGAGKVETQATLEMLGTVAMQTVTELLEALAGRDVGKLTAVLGNVTQMGANYPQVLARLAEQLHQLAFLQAVGGSSGPEAELSQDTAPRLKALVDAFTPEDLQLKFQFAIMGAKDVASAPDPRLAFEMCLLRMMAFTDPAVTRAPPAMGSDGPGGSGFGSTNASSSGSSGDPSSAAPGTGAHRAIAKNAAPEGMPSSSAAGDRVLNALQLSPQAASPPKRLDFPARPVAEVIATPVAALPSVNVQAISSDANSAEQSERWRVLVENLDLASGPVRELARNAVAAHWDTQGLLLHVDESFELLATPLHLKTLCDAVQNVVGTPVQARLQKTDVAHSPRALDTLAANAEQLSFERSLASDPVVSALIEQFGAGIVPGSALISAKTLH